MPSVSGEADTLQTRSRDITVIDEVCQSKLDVLDKELEEGDITLKGYWKKKCALLEPFLLDIEKRKMDNLLTEFKNSKISESDYYRQLEEIVRGLLNSSIKRDLDTNISSETDHSNGVSVNGHSKKASTNGRTANNSENGHTDRSRNGQHSNGSTNAYTSKNGLSGFTNGQVINESSNGQSGKEMVDENESLMLCDQESDMSNDHSKVTTDTPSTGGETKVPNRMDGNDTSNKNCDEGEYIKNQIDSDVIEIKEESIKSEDESAPPPAKKSRGRPSKEKSNGRTPSSGETAARSPKEERTPTRASRRLSNKTDQNQPSIMSMFSMKPKSESSQDQSRTSVDKTDPVRKEESPAEDDQDDDDDDSEEGNQRKRIKIQEEVEKKDKEGIIPAISPSPAKPLPQRCNECLKYMDDPELKLFPGDPDTAVEEFIALTDPRLSLFTGEEDFDNMTEDRPQHKITDFSIYDKNTHLCAFDTGLIERNKYLFFSGVLKPIFEENPSPEGGVPCRNMGPINEWFISGFDGGENALIGFSTAYAEYILMQPSEAYSPFIEQMKVKVHMAKIVIEFLSNNQDASYEDLLNKVQTTVPPAGLSGLTSFTEDSLLRHAQFVVDQVQSYDDAAAEDESLLITTPCMRSLIKLAGVTLGKRRQLRKDVGKVKVKKEKQTQTRATVTPLVRGIFDSIFQGQILDEDMKTKKRQRCGFCEVCQQPDCGTCTACKDMTKFGGTGKAKQACKQRRCPNLAIKSAEEDDGEEGEEAESENNKEPALTTVKKHKSARTGKARATWVGQPIKMLGKKSFYDEVLVGDLMLRPGDCISISHEDPKQPYYIARIQYLFENAKGERQAHVQWFYRGSETVLGEASDPLELFFVDECDDSDLVAVHDKVKIIYKEAPEDWSMRGGLEEDGSLLSPEEDDGKTYFFQKAYTPDLGRFEDPPAMALNGFQDNTEEADGEREVDHCVICQMAADQRRENAVGLGEVLDSTSSNMVYYQSVRKEGQEYRIGDCCYVDPEFFDFQIKHPKIVPKVSKPSKVDEDVYPEAYRKTEYVKGSNDKCPEPFRVVRISEIYVKKNSVKQDGLDIYDIKLKANKFYRTENTHKGSQGLHYTDLNKLYWSEEMVILNFSQVGDKCTVIYQDNLEQSVDSYFLGGCDRFYFSEAYSASSREFEEPPSHARMMGGKGKSKGKGKGKGKGKSNVKEESSGNNGSLSEEKIDIHRLRTLDVFAGCGGLSEGFHQAGIAESRWAIEKEEPAAQAFRLNNPGCTVFTDDCNLLLQRVMEGNNTNALGQKLPQKGDVELLCGGPPCQGFSGMNRFNHGDYSRFKNSLIASYLSYCDYYRPRFFLLENVRNFVSFKRSMVLKLTLRSLLRMGYQCTFGVLQAGSYGVAQTRRRAIILAAAPGEKLPLYPEPMHTFAPRAMQLSVVVDDKKVTPEPYDCTADHKN
ncbi:DNA (cytosine-5)-methyltransferase [Plakobranchus ocellatus]|uniref:DNA (cytosine-5)-methyltransferase n=1 Tax=Plakobranchus ocellatus TaxID=259542 RepID=A0AAV3YJT9_9GAST|nr:DNA (cytosine-5)-methyltransferase [Plakobranchus ocellatus]